MRRRYSSMRWRWRIARSDTDWDASFAGARAALAGAFAATYSRSLQQTLYAMGEAVLKAVKQVREIELTMPNIHCLLVDLSRFKQDNPNEIFVPTDEPHGYIEARVRRKG